MQNDKGSSQAHTPRVSMRGKICWGVWGPRIETLKNCETNNNKQDSFIYILSFTTIIVVAVASTSTGLLKFSLFCFLYAPAYFQLQKP